MLQTDIGSKGALEKMKVPMKLNFKKGCVFYRQWKDQEASFIKIKNSFFCMLMEILIKVDNM